MATTIWKGHLSFGLVTIPVKLYRAARAEKVSFHQLYRAPAAPQTTQEKVPLEEHSSRPVRGFKAPISTASAVEAEARRQPLPEPEPQLSRVRQAAWVPPVEEAPNAAVSAPVSRNDLVRGYEYEPDKYVVVSDEDLRGITPETRKQMQILEFVHFAEIDPVYLESSYYVVPDGGGEKAYALLFEALRQTGYAALAELAMHRREHVVIIRPGARGLLAHTMFYASEVRSEEEFRTDTSLVVGRELDMAKLLVEALVAKFEPGKYRDTYREKLEAIIQARVEGRQVAGAAEAPRQQKVVDIMEALQNSLAAARRTTETQAAPSPAERKPASTAAGKPRASKRAGRG